jgi:hypothetical protein
MNKNDLISAVADVSGLSKGDAVKAVEAVFDPSPALCPRVTKCAWSVLARSRWPSARRRPAATPHGRTDGDQGFGPAQVQGGQGPQGRGELIAPIPARQKGAASHADAAPFLLWKKMRAGCQSSSVARVAAA